jgi:ketosteroid isomerase-like protein
VRTRKLYSGLAGVAITLSIAMSLAAADRTETAVITAEHQWLRAEQTNNVNLLLPLLADRVVLTTEDGRVITGKAAVLSDAKATTWSSAEYQDLQVTVFGRTAIATGTFTGRGADTSGKSFDSRIRFTDTWVQMPDGAWLCVAGHDSPIKP